MRFALYTCLLIISTTVSQQSCKANNNNDMASPIPTPEEPQAVLTYLALGDSYTIGEGVREAERWPVQLSSQLNAAGIKVQSPLIIARTGWTTDELMAELDRRAISDTFDLVSLLIGVNNQYRGRPSAQFRAELIQLINRAIRYAGGDSTKLFLVSIPDWGVTPFAAGRDRARIAREIDEYNEVIRQEAEARKLLFFNITDISRLAAGDNSLLADDRLHPSGKMYRMWVELILPGVIKSLKNNE